jgi:hypothetical protein
LSFERKDLITRTNSSHAHPDQSFLRNGKWGPPHCTIYKAQFGVLPGFGRSTEQPQKKDSISLVLKW